MLGAMEVQERTLATVEGSVDLGVRTGEEFYRVIMRMLLEYSDIGVHLCPCKGHPPLVLLKNPQKLQDSLGNLTLLGDHPRGSLDLACLPADDIRRMQVSKELPEGVHAQYMKNAAYLEDADAHAVYPTSIYRQCDALTLATQDGLLGLLIPYCPEGPSTQYLRFLVPTATPFLVFGTRVLKCWVLGPSGG